MGVGLGVTETTNAERAFPHPCGAAVAKTSRGAGLDARRGGVGRAPEAHALIEDGATRDRVRGAQLAHIARECLGVAADVHHAVKGGGERAARLVQTRARGIDEERREAKAAAGAEADVRLPKPLEAAHAAVRLCKFLC